MTKKDIKIVFFGTPEFAVYSLDKLVQNGFNVAAVVTMPDKPAGRGHKMLQSAVKQYAVEHNLPLFQPVKLKDDEFLNQLKAIGADLFIVIAFRMLPEAVWAMPPMGTFNLHASLLPRYRGAAPINRAIMNGDTETGVTTFMLQHEIDTGDVLSQVKVEIAPEDNIGDVHDRLMEVGGQLTLDTIEHLIAGDIKPIPQSELEAKNGPTSAAPKIFTEDCIIDWSRPAVEIHNQVRGLSPYPAARSSMANGGSEPEMMKILRTALSEKTTENAPGTIVVEGGKRMFVATGDGRLLEILEVHPAGKKKMSTDAFLRGAHLSNPHFMPLDSE